MYVGAAACPCPMSGASQYVGAAARPCPMSKAKIKIDFTQHKASHSRIGFLRFVNIYVCFSHSADWAGTRHCPYKYIPRSIATFRFYILSFLSVRLRARFRLLRQF